MPDLSTLEGVVESVNDRLLASILATSVWCRLDYEEGGDNTKWLTGLIDCVKQIARKVGADFDKALAASKVETAPGRDPDAIVVGSHDGYAFLKYCHSQPLTAKDLRPGDLFVLFPSDGDDHGHGGFRGGARLLRKCEPHHPGVGWHERVRVIGHSVENGYEVTSLDAGIPVYKIHGVAPQVPS